MTFKSIKIDEEGFPLFNGLRTQDEEFGKELLEGIRKLPDRRIFFCDYNNEKYVVEAFDQPYVAQQVYRSNTDHWQIALPYGIFKNFDIHSLRIDEWDRFHGRTDGDIPFVFTKKAQDEFFNLVDEVFEDYIELGDQKIYFKKQYDSDTKISQDSFWTDLYLDTQNPPGWDLKTHHPILEYILPQLKISKTRVLVLGCGKGHDCAYLAMKGHLVTGVDFSETAIEEAKKLYPNLPNLKFVKADAFQLPDKFRDQFDLIFEHTFYCAIEPSRRTELLSVWKQCLTEGGFLLGIFFTMDSQVAPPFGGTEWEYRERLKNDFQFLFWTRWQGPTPRSSGAELVIYAKKLK